MLNEAFQLFQSVERGHAQIESSLIPRTTAVKTSLEVAHENIEKLESRLASLETELQPQATENRKAAIMYGLRSIEFNLLFHGISTKEKSETSETSEKIIRTFLKNCTFLFQNSIESYSRTFTAFHRKSLLSLHPLLLLHHPLL